MRTKKSSAAKVIKATVSGYTALFERAAEGGFTVTVAALPGVVTEGDTLKQAKERTAEAIRGYLASLRKDRRRVRLH